MTALKELGSLWILLAGLLTVVSSLCSSLRVRTSVLARFAMHPFSEFDLPDAQSLRGLASVLRIALTTRPSLRKAVKLFPTQGLCGTAEDEVPNYVPYGL